MLSRADFQKKSPGERKEFAEAHNLCLNCFGRHQLAACPFKRSCAACKQRHHSSIHDVSSAGGDGSGTVSTSLHARNPRSERAFVLLATARVLIRDKYGKSFSIRALIDPGSEVSLVAESLVQRLQIPRAPAATTIYGIGGQRTGVSRGKVTIAVTSRINGSSVPVTALILDRITIYGGRVGSSTATWAHVRDLPLADPDFRAADSVEMLLGADVYATIVEHSLRKGETGNPIAQKTMLGWLLSGAIGETGPHGPHASHQCSTSEDLTDLVTRFWE